VEGNVRGINDVLSRHPPWGTKEVHEKLQRDSNWIPLEYKPEALPPETNCSVTFDRGRSLSEITISAFARRNLGKWKASARIFGISAQTRIQYLSSKSLKRYRYVITVRYAPIQACVYDCVYKYQTKRERGRAIAQAVSRWLPTTAVRGSKPDLGMWDLWWDRVALGRFSPNTSVSPAIVVRSTNYSTITLIYHPGKMYNRPMYGRSTGTYKNLGDLQRDLRGLSPTPPKKKYGTHYIILRTQALRSHTLPPILEHKAMRWHCHKVFMTAHRILGAACWAKRVFFEVWSEILRRPIFQEQAISVWEYQYYIILGHDVE
jgi:hypothetical protein